ncbi:protein FAR1-RELATED SEQUENCE 5-like [Lotus japonicus]|uniref:protein FAR1-RELATED SEQUENCE 5-like n=1 Tax=Lotus japonicus TaxID=34305 RepID=UPI00258AF312|nr:protein FAR1-RELATED SEQUENCE 5-like [Lotus japonicus]
MGNVNFKILNGNNLKMYRFSSREVAFLFYNMYARVKGFSARKDKLLRDKNRQIIQQNFVCHKQGRRTNIFGDERTRKREPMKDIRCGCRAECRVHIDCNSNRWYVKYFDDEHNHLLVRANHAGLLPRHRRMQDADIMHMNHMRRAQNGIRNIYGSFANQMGGYENVPFSIHAMYNEVDKQRKKELPDGRGALAYLRSLKRDDPDMYWRHVTDERRRLVQIFWTDGHCQRDYSVFGDVLAFDATYKKKKYCCPLEVFSGINHHNKTIIFGAAVVSDESKETYVWVLEQFLDAMKGKMPTSVITDGDKAMKKAIEIVFPNSYHRLCAWHLIQNATRNIKIPKFLPLFKNCMFGEFSVAEFERKWEDMVAVCEVQDESWVNEMYEKRTMWATSHFRGKFFAGFRTTSRAEGLNCQIGRYVNVQSNLKEFMESFNRCTDYFRFKEIEDDLRSMEGEQVLITPLVGLERSASNIYTREIFILFRTVLSNASTFRVLGKKRTATRVIYFVGKYKSHNREWNVSYCPVKIDFKCSCLKMESVGIPCNHVVAVMLALDMGEIPESLILGRWTKHAKESVNVQYQSKGWDPLQTCRYVSLLESCTQMCKLACRTPVVNNHTKKLEANHDHEDEVGHDVDEDEVLDRHVGNPAVVRTKGCGRGGSKPNLGGRRRFHCGICGGLGHNRKTCSMGNQANIVQMTDGVQIF